MVTCANVCRREEWMQQVPHEVPQEIAQGMMQEIPGRGGFAGPYDTLRRTRPEESNRATEHHSWPVGAPCWPART